jgi:hypothetical protein
MKQRKIEKIIEKKRWNKMWKLPQWECGNMAMKKCYERDKVIYTELMIS